jgi:hypothetical protein
MEVYKLTEEQKNALNGATYDGVQYFNPVLDAENNWFISIEEVNGCTNESFLWVKDLPLINYNPIIYERF